MITLKLKQCNNQIEKYYKYCESLETISLECSCGCKGQCEKHAYYVRRVSIQDNIYDIKILRIRCKHCGKTHAIIPDIIIPYIRLSRSEVITLVIENENSIINSSDEELYRLLKLYKTKWINRLYSLGLHIKHEITELISFCALRFKLCFMQNHKGIFFESNSTHITC